MITNIPFKIHSKYQPTGDQPDAIKGIVSGLREDKRYQTVLGVTGSGKTFTMANIIEKTNRPALILAHNKTLAAQLYSEFKEFFPENRVEYFVSYYDYYQPEAYIAGSDMYIEKDASINEEIDRLRHSATEALLSRRDTIIISSVSCIYGIGSPEEYAKIHMFLETNQDVGRRDLLMRLSHMQYERNDIDFSRTKFRVRGDTVDIYPAYGETAIRVELFGDTIDAIKHFDPLTNETIESVTAVEIFPATHFVASSERVKSAISSIESELKTQLKHLSQNGYVLEEQRLRERTKFDIEMLAETGYCNGIENYSRHFDGRNPGESPYVLLDYLQSDAILFIDESHITVPQIGAMYNGDRSRKENLVRYGFRLPSALDNRPLQIDEFWERVGQTVFVSATPAKFEKEHSEQIVELIVRPTGLLDPKIQIKESKTQVKDVLGEIQKRIKKGERALITTLTKKDAENLADFLLDKGIKANYLHSDVKTIERVKVLSDLRHGNYDVIVGINLLREGLDLPEVSLVAIFDADKQGFLRSETALIQTIGRAARHLDGTVIMYAEKMSDAMKKAIDETNRRRQIQDEYNKAHGITPTSIQKALRNDFETEEGPKRESSIVSKDTLPMTKEERKALIKELEIEMQRSVQRLEFEEAAMLRDRIKEVTVSLTRDF
jgi:excinuclease ABC subunit B